MFSIATRAASALFLAIAGPLVYLSGNKLSVTIPNSITPSATPVHRLQQYLRIRTDHPDPSYLDAQQFLNRTVSELLPNATYSVFESVPGKPVIFFTILGSRPKLPSVLLNSHTDVVPADESHWHSPPFGAKVVYETGQLRVYARGSQDMKSIGLQYIEALAELTKQKWNPLRNVVVSFVPDEEVGGKEGMATFVQSSAFKALNIGVALDEGLPRNDAQFNCYYSERLTWWFVVEVIDTPGHCSTLPERTATIVLHRILARALKYRDTQLLRLKRGEDLGDVVSVNIASLDAGFYDSSNASRSVYNVISSVATASFDVRVPPTMDVKDIDTEIDSWISCDDQSNCPDVKIKWVMKSKRSPITSRDPNENEYITPFMAGMEKAGIADRLKHGIFPAATDARYLRSAGIPSFGFSPIDKSPDLLHKHNEYLPVDTYLRGIQIYKNIIKELAYYEPEGATKDNVPLMDDQSEGAKTTAAANIQAESKEGL